MIKYIMKIKNNYFRATFWKSALGHIKIELLLKVNDLGNQLSIAIAVNFGVVLYD